MTEKISYAILDMDELSNEQQQEVAGWVANYLETVGYEQYKMLKKTPEQILAKMGKVAYLVTGTHELGQKIGFQGSEQPTEGPYGAMAEVGTLFVLEEFQHKGVAANLKKAMVDKLVTMGVVPYSFNNDNSRPLATALGFTEATAADVPLCAIEACGDCSIMKAGLVAPGKCCDTIMMYKGDK